MPIPSTELRTNRVINLEIKNRNKFTPPSKECLSLRLFHDNHNSLQMFLVFSPSRGIEISFVVFKSVSWYLNPSRVIQTCNVVFKSGSWYSNSSRGIQIRLVAFKFVSWWAIVLVVFKFVCTVLWVIAVDFPCALL